MDNPQQTHFNLEANFAVVASLAFLAHAASLISFSTQGVDFALGLWLLLSPCPSLSSLELQYWVGPAQSTG